MSAQTDKSPTTINPASTVLAPPVAAADAAVRPAIGRVMMVGLRGIPNVQGGVEKHVEMLGWELAKRGWQIEVIGRSRYCQSMTYWEGITIRSLWAPRSTTLEALVHTLLGVCYAAWKRPDVLHIHAIGPSLTVPLARLFGLNVVVTHHGYDYDRQKWGRFAKAMLHVGEFLGMRIANGRISIARDVADTMRGRYGVPVTFIPNGVNALPVIGETGILDEFALAPRRYILLAARFVPEKRQLDLIRAFEKLGRSDIKLVLAGNAEFESAYAREVAAAAAATPNVVLTGFQTGQRLAELFSRAALFVLPSSHEGMPIALLEALAHGLPVLASNIRANLDLDLTLDDYFPLGDTEALTRAMARKLSEPEDAAKAQQRMRDIACAYDWSSVAQKTGVVYAEAMRRRL